MSLISYVKSARRGSPQSPAQTGGAGANAAGPYSVTLLNRSHQPWTFFMYQQLANRPANVRSVVWFCSPYLIGPGNQITFQWMTDYTFVWSSSGELQPGMVFSAEQTIQADPVSANVTNFYATGNPGLSTPTAGSPQGSLVINNAPSVPNNTFSVGIGMGETAALVAPSVPNVPQTFMALPPTYWIAATNNVQLGTILNAEMMNQNCQVNFSGGSEAYYTLGSFNEWMQD